MLVRNQMMPIAKLYKISPDDTISKALEVLNKNNLMSAPVLKGDKFYGAISKNSIYEFYFEKCPDKQSLLSDFKVSDVMRTDVPVIEPGENLEKAVKYLEQRNISFVAVVNDHGEFQGIITHHAIFHEFTDLFGVGKGKRISVIAFDIPGQISKLSRIVTENKGDIISFVVVDPESVTEVKEIVMRINTDNFESIVEKIKNAGFKVQ